MTARGGVGYELKGFPTSLKGLRAAPICPRCGDANVCAGECISCGWNFEDHEARRIAIDDPLRLKWGMK